MLLRHHSLTYSLLFRPYIRAKTLQSLAALHRLSVVDTTLPSDVTVYTADADTAVVAASLSFISRGDFELVVIKLLAQLLEERLDEGYMIGNVMGPWLQMMCLQRLRTAASPDRDAIIGLIQRVVTMAASHVDKQQPSIHYGFI